MFDDQHESFNPSLNNLEKDGLGASQEQINAYNERRQSQNEVNIMNIIQKSDIQQKVQNEKNIRCKDFLEGKYGPIPLYFKENTAKEELVLEHVIQFKKQFQLLYNDERQLLLYPVNECETQKFICTTIRPTKLGYLELYDWETAAKYLSEFIAYEELDPPHRFPRYIPSPSNTLMWQKGDSFDISIVLASLLIGVGYDAYCVYGLAPREVTSKNEGEMENPFQTKGELKDEEVLDNFMENFSKENEFAIIKKQEVYSKFDREALRKLEEENLKKMIEAKLIDDDEPDQMFPDPYIGKRMHCWIFVKKGKRDVQESFFIEPSTGRKYELQHNPYISVDSMFNHQNFFINMQPNLQVNQIDFSDLYVDGKWEYVMLRDDTFSQKTQQTEPDEYQNNYQEIQDESKQNVNTQNLGDLDMPPAWPPKLYIDKEQFLKLSPLGENTAFYVRSRVDTYASYSQPDGLVQRIILYEDYKRIRIREIRYFYQHRSDKLNLRRRYPFQFTTIEEYDPGKAPHWKQVIQKDRQRREITFYKNRNQDGLVKRIEIIGQKTIEYYENRDDRIIYRSVRFYPKEKDMIQNTKEYSYNDYHIKGPVVVTKMTQKFELNSLLQADQQIAKMIINLDSNKNSILIIYHMNEGQISPNIKEIKRDQMKGIQKINESANQKKDGHSALNLQEHTLMSNMEKECFSAIKNQEVLAEDDEKLVREYPIVLEKTLQDKAREKYKQAQQKRDEDGLKDTSKDDYLYPFLEKKNLINKKLTKNEAIDIKAEVMNKLRERLLSRADIIQRRLEEERLNLEKYEQMIQKKGESLNKEDEGKTEAEISQLHFKIEILEQRASRFEVMAFQKYEEMDRRLNMDPRLQEALQYN